MAVQHSPVRTRSATTNNETSEPVPPTGGEDQGAVGGQTNETTTSTVRYNCKTCERPDNLEMVQCDKCDQWHHFDCVGVDHTVANRDWLCPTCFEQSRRQRRSSERLSSISSSTRMSQVDISMRRLELLRQRESVIQQQLNELDTIEAQENNTNAARERVAHRTGAIPRTQPHSTGPTLSSVLNAAINRSQADAAATRSRTPHMYDFPLPPGNSTTNGPPGNSTTNGPPGNNPTNEPPPTGPSATSAPHTGPAHDTGSQRRPNAQPASSTPHEPQNHRQNLHHSTNPIHGPQSGSFNSTGDVESLTHQMQRLMIRQAIPKELPSFSGKPEEWNTFLSAYEQTTSMGQYTNAENLPRLQLALKGKAKDLVASQLSLPECVPRIIETLTNVYGRPQRLINNQIERIRRFPPLRQERLETFIEFSVLLSNLAATLSASGLNATYRDNPVLVQEIINKLPARYKLEWAQYVREHPEIIARDGELMALNDRVHQIAMDACTVMDKPFNEYDSKHDSRHDPRHNSRYDSKDKDNRNRHQLNNAHFDDTSDEEFVDCDSGPEVNVHQVATKNNPLCSLCKKHCDKLEECKQFLDMPLNEKWEYVRTEKLCRICLGKHPKKCWKLRRCGVDDCEKLHHPTLHYIKEQSKAELHSCQLVNNKTLFRVIPIRIKGKNKMITTFAFLDEGSSVSLMDENLAQELELSGEKKPLHLKWTGNNSRMEDDSQIIQINVVNPNDERNHYQLNVRTVKSLNLPPQSLNYAQIRSNRPYLSNLPVQSYDNARPMLLLGIDAQRYIVPTQVREDESGNLIATKCSLGWTISGQQSHNLSNDDDDDTNIHMINAHVCDCLHQADDKIDEMFKAYLKIDSIGINQNPYDLYTQEEKEAMNQMRQKTTKKDNRYETGLLWKYKNAQLPDSYPMAKRRWYCQKIRMEKDSLLKKKCNEQIKMYLDKGYIRKLPDEELHVKHDKIWYLPVFPVSSKTKPDKTRLVWDAAAPVNGSSLNTFLHSGPDINTPLLDILLRFREHKYGINADIEQMFHRISINEEDQHCQRFLWYDFDDPDVDYATYVMKVVTFGATCSPYQAQFIKNLNAESYAINYPSAVLAVNKGHYVDDFLASYETEEETIKVAKQVKEIHQGGNFNLRNWRSNSKKVLEAMGESVQSQRVDMLSEHVGQADKVLGMWWQTTDDQLTFSLQFVSIYKTIIESNRPPTKRMLLKLLMSIYDPLGLLSQFMVGLKSILQKVQKTATGWDEEIDESLNAEFNEWIQYLPQIENLKLPRCYLDHLPSYSDSKVSLHTFVDANENAMSAAVYLRIQQGNDVKVTLVAAKSKNAPTKKTSIPRLELQAAVIGARLTQSVKNALSININDITYWTDNRAVLAWIKSRSMKLTPFVAFRVSEIHELTQSHQWRWIPTDYNVADEGTKFHSPPNLNSSARWYRGPSFLYEEEVNWPTQPHLVDEDLVMLHTEQEPFIAYEKYSSWLRLLRVTTYVCRFIDQANQRTYREFKQLLYADEIRKAKNFLLRQAQIDEYPYEYRALRIGKELDKESVLYKLSPMMDKSGLIRIRGRIDRCKSAEDGCKHPIILPRNHRITTLIIQDEHTRLDHQYDDTVVNNLRQSYYIPEIRVAVKLVRKQCQTCSNKTASPVTPEEAELPEGRVSCYTRPFTHVGIDYFGPFMTVCGRRRVKVWGVIFTCLTIRAIHIEIVDSLTTDACITAIRCFINRRGAPRAFYTDRGTNFIGAERELKDELKYIDPQMIAEKFVSPTVEWYFNTAAAAHMGGSWERLIRSIKKSLMPWLACRDPTRQELYAYLTEVENIINSRPLTYLPIDSAESEALTPNHFLLGSSNGVKPIGPLDDSVTLFRKSWLNIQNMAQTFWKRWIHEYLPDLVKRTKWFNPNTPELREGDVVLIVDGNLPRYNWPKGRVLEVIPSKDGKVRSAVVQTSQGVYTRHVIKLARLDVGTQVEGLGASTGGSVETGPKSSSGPSETPKAI